MSLMRRRAAGVAVLLILLATAPALARQEAAGEKVINADGVAAVGKGDVGAARDKALDDALRKAVEQAVGTLIESETMVQNYQILNDSIYSQTKGFVKSYKIVSEKQDGPLYKVTIAATVSVGDVKGDLQSLGLLIERMRRPRVVVMIPEENLHDSGWWSHWASNIGTVESIVIRSLKAKEFTVMDQAIVRKSIDKEAALKAMEGDNAEAARIAQQTGAEVLVTGQAEAAPAGSVAGSQVNSYQASVTIRAVKADTGEILGTSTGSGKAVHLNSTAGGTEALKQAGSMAADDLISQIVRQWAKEASGTRMIAVSVTALSKDLVDKVVSVIGSEVRGVSQVFLREYAQFTARLDVDYKGDGQTLSHDLQGLVVPGGTLRVTTYSANKIDVKFIPD